MGDNSFSPVRLKRKRSEKVLEMQLSHAIHSNVGSISSDSALIFCPPFILLAFLVGGVVVIGKRYNSNSSGPRSR